MKGYDDKLLDKIIKKSKKIGKQQTKKYRDEIGFESSNYIKFLKKAADLKSWQKNYDELIMLTENISQKVEDSKKDYSATKDKNSRIIKKRALEILLYLKQLFGELVYKYETLKSLKEQDDRYELNSIIEEIDNQDGALLTEALKLAKDRLDSPLLLDCLCRKYLNHTNFTNDFQPIVDELKKYQTSLAEFEIKDSDFKERLEKLRKERQEMNEYLGYQEQDIEHILDEFDTTPIDTTKSRLESQTNEEETENSSSRLDNIKHKKHIISYAFLLTNARV